MLIIQYHNTTDILTTRALHITGVHEDKGGPTHSDQLLEAILRPHYHHQQYHALFSIWPIIITIHLIFYHCHPCRWKVELGQFDGMGWQDRGELGLRGKFDRSGGRWWSSGGGGGEMRLGKRVDLPSSLFAFVDIIKAIYIIIKNRFW